MKTPLAAAISAVGNAVVTMTPRIVPTLSYVFYMVVVTAQPLGTAPHTFRHHRYNDCNIILTIQFLISNTSQGASSLGLSVL